jgi:hypothetical protein
LAVVAGEQRREAGSGENGGEHQAGDERQH